MIGKQVHSPDHQGDIGGVFVFAGPDGQIGVHGVFQYRLHPGVQRRGGAINLLAEDGSQGRSVGKNLIGKDGQNIFRIDQDGDIWHLKRSFLYKIIGKIRHAMSESTLLLYTMRIIPAMDFPFPFFQIIFFRLFQAAQMGV